MTDHGVTHLLVNGRFLSRTFSGVDRVALELIRAIAADARGRIRLSLAIPANVSDAQLAELDDVSFTAIHRGRTVGQRWEQIELRGLEPRLPLLSLANMGPLFRRNQVIMLHDAQVMLAPESFSLGFRSWYRVAHPILGRMARVVITNSHYSLAQLERFGVIPVGRGSVVHLAADHIGRVEPDTAALTRYGLVPHDYLLAIGNLAPHKNLAMLMRAAGSRPPGSLELIVAGGMNKRVFQDAGLVAPPGVRLIGRVTDAELKALYMHARLFAFPSLTEGFGLPPLEAMTCGCPVIATTAGAVPEICQDAALLVDPLDQDGWTRALTDLADDPQRRADLIARGHARMGEFSWRSAARAVLDLLPGHGHAPCRS